MSGPLHLEVKLFAAVREAVGRDRVEVELEAEATVAGLLDALCARHPEVAPHRPGLGVAVNRALARGDRKLEAGDEVALIPPVGGG